MEHTAPIPANLDWTSLPDVIQYAESLGAGWTVFSVKGNSGHFAITESKNISTSGMSTGNYLGVIGLGIFVVAEKVYVRYRTKRRVICS